MPLWAVLACTVLGTIGNVLTYIAMVNANRKLEERRNKEMERREGKRTLKFDQMWEEYKKNHGIIYDNGDE